MLSVPDLMVVSVVALLLFGPDRLPKVMRQAGRFMRDLQNTSHSFIAEMERAADTTEVPPPPPPAPEPLSLNLKTDPQNVESPETEAQGDAKC
jgi:TatA/E family protein of Tat protein translocase